MACPEPPGPRTGRPAVGPGTRPSGALLTLDTLARSRVQTAGSAAAASCAGRVLLCPCLRTGRDRLDYLFNERTSERTTAQSVSERVMACEHASSAKSPIRTLAVREFDDAFDRTRHRKDAPAPQVGLESPPVEGRLGHRRRQEEQRKALPSSAGSGEPQRLSRSLRPRRMLCYSIPATGVLNSTRRGANVFT